LLIPSAVLSLSSADSNPFQKSSSSSVMGTPPRLRLDPPAAIDSQTRALENTGVYETEEETLRGFACPSPKSPTVPRPRTEIDLVLPPVSAFSKKGV
jgi:hypothetical protein